MEDNSRSFNLWKILLVLAHRKVFIIAFVLICTLGALAVSLLLPKWFRAKTSILPPQYDQSLGITGNFAQYSLSSSGFELPIMATPSDVYATMLKSDRVGLMVNEDLGLREHYEQPSDQHCLIYLADKTDIRVTGEGVIELYFEDRDPEMAALVANTYISSLDAVNRQVKTHKARSDREFIHARLEKTKALLDSAKTRLLNFQKENNAVDIEKQRDLTLDAASEIKSRLALTKISLDVKRRIYSADHPEIKRLQVEAEELENQLNILERGSEERSYVNMPLSEIPRLTAEYEQLKAEAALQEKVFSLLTELYEEARIKEQKNTPTISVLETAYPPQIKYKPKRSFIVLAALLTSLALAVFISLFADYLENLRRTSPSDFDLMDQARNRFTGKTGYSDS